MIKSVVQIVRRFGRVGGMESYVWFLSHSLLRLDYQVTVICETVEDVVDPAIELIVVGKSKNRRRWRAMRDFSGALDQVFSSDPRLSRSIVHSHERTGWHDVTTFHGPPMPIMDSLPWYQRFSRRLKYWMSLERREICNAQVQMVIPVSKMIGDQLVARYPECTTRIAEPIYPCLENGVPRSFRSCERSIKLIFVGREWKRKGLHKAVEFVKELRVLCDVTLDVFGVSIKDVPRKLRLPWVAYHGYCQKVTYANYDMLIHPAKMEPFGMVVVEALSMGCRVMVSDRVGAKELNHDGLSVVDLDAPLSHWLEVAQADLKRVPTQVPSFSTWTDVAELYDRSIYAHVTH